MVGGSRRPRSRRGQLSDQTPQREQAGLTVPLALIFYGLMSAVAVAAAAWADLDILVWHDEYATSLALDAGLGVAVGLVVVAISALLERYTEWARRLGDAFSELLGPMSWTKIFLFALTSSVGEELLFRGFLQQWLSVSVLSGELASWGALVIASVLFGLIHTGSDRKTFLPWTAMALVMGFVLGGLYMYSGNVLAPVLCHFTINFINLGQISRRAQ